MYVYAVEWPTEDQRNLHDWHGVMSILVRLDCHSQQVCGFSWSIDNTFLASGGNDNCVYIYETKKILSPKRKSGHPVDSRLAFSNSTAHTPNYSTTIHPLSPTAAFPTLPASAAKHRITLSAAVKALAFAPFSTPLLALGAGSNDRAIHFHSATSAAKLAAVDCAAQVTSLTWSTTRAELCATFGFAQPDHRVRLAVYAWPSCAVVVRVEWPADASALWGIAYPGGPAAGRRAREGARSCRSRTSREGCLVVAASDASIKFHEVWSDGPGGRRICEGGGMFGDDDGEERKVVR